MAPGKIMYGNWSFRGGLPGNKEHVAVTTNGEPDLIEAIGRVLSGTPAAC